MALDRKTVSGPIPPFAAFDGSTAIGTTGFYVLGGPKVSHRGVIWGMYVSPEHRRQGIGRKLIGSVIDHARGRVEQIHLYVVTTNIAAYDLYRSMGFVAYGVEPRALRYAGRDYDEAMMVFMMDNPGSVPLTVRPGGIQVKHNPSGPAPNSGTFRIGGFAPGAVTPLDACHSALEHSLADASSSRAVPAVT